MSLAIAIVAAFTAGTVAGFALLALLQANGRD